MLTIKDCNTFHKFDNTKYIGYNSDNKTEAVLLNLESNMFRSSNEGSVEPLIMLTEMLSEINDTSITKEEFINAVKLFTKNILNENVDKEEKVA